MPIIDYRAGFIIGVSVLVGAAAAGNWWFGEKSSPNLCNMLDALDQASVKIKNKEKVEELLRKFISGGRQKLQVVADFDRTLSRYKSPDGEIVATCHNVFETCGEIWPRYGSIANKLRDTYYPIELDDSLTKEQKYPYMVEWWTKSHDLLVECGLTQSLMKEAVTLSNIILRDHSDWLLKELNKYEVPLLIFSAGLGDIIEEVIKEQYTMYSNIKVVSNYMDFNNQGQLVGFKEDIIHIYNKNENAIHNSDYFENLQHRENIILMGDSLGDLNMADGAVESANILKIGFLNDKVDERLALYMDSYDIVLLSDETMDVPNAILKMVLES